MKWAKERDLLIAQTMTFVQSITGKKPDLEARTPEARPAEARAVEGSLPEHWSAENLPPASRIETRIAFARIEGIDRVDLPVEIVNEIVAAPPEPLPPQPMPPLRLPMPPRSGLREEIQGRVAAFRAHQQLFNREREEYFKSVLTKARASIESQPRTPRR
jgi:hypothetical protein